MIPVELELENFLAYQDPGPLNLEGIHVACLAGPNGAGKSSLLDAITWALWGKARSNSPDELIHQGRKQMRVALTFEHEESRFRVIRQRKTGKRGVSLLEFQGWDQASQEWHSISEATIRATQEKINGMLRLDYETFVNSAFLVQGRADEFTTKTPNQRKQVLADILGLSLWELFERRAKDRIGETKSEIERLDGWLQEVERELSQREQHEKQLKQADELARQAAKQLELAEENWSSLEQARAELVSLQRQIDDLTRRIQTREKEISQTTRTLESLAPRADAGAIKASLDTLLEELALLEPLQKRHADLTAQRLKLAEESARLMGINQTLGPETEPLKARAATLDSATDPTCPTCGQSLTDEHRSTLLQELHQEVERRRRQYRTHRERIAEIEQLISKLDLELSELNGKLRQGEGLQKRVGELEASLGHADEVAQQAISLGDQIARWEKELRLDKGNRKELESKAAASEQQLKAASLTQADLDRLRLEKRLADERVGGARQQLAALDAFEEQSKVRLQRRNQVAQDLGLYEDLRLAFGKRGVPAMIIETAVPEIEQAANELLERMTDGRLRVRFETQRETKAGDLREALDIIISDELGSRSYELYSGGEAFRINFAIRIALSSLLARRAGAKLRSLFIDEGFGTQDARGREQLISAINSVQDNFDRILVITHIDELKDAFPARIEVRKTSQGSQFSLS